MYSENLTHNTFNQSGVAIAERTQGSLTEQSLTGYHLPLLTWRVPRVLAAGGCVAAEGAMSRLGRDTVEGMRESTASVPD